mmetsp:Transcript_20001/g.48993  ORF Transcript_20001/g.48993 Transcript_20001/m.48993 type:complete len:408 (-) Transcript_20001:415-1638(-)
MLCCCSSGDDGAKVSRKNTEDLRSDEMKDGAAAKKQGGTAAKNQEVSPKVGDEEGHGREKKLSITQGSVHKKKTKTEFIVEVVKHPFGIRVQNCKVIKSSGAAKDQGIEIGDRVVSIAGQIVKDNPHLIELFDSSNLPFKMRIVRDPGDNQAVNVDAQDGKETVENEKLAAVDDGGKVEDGNNEERDKKENVQREATSKANEDAVANDGTAAKTSSADANKTSTEGKSTTDAATAQESSNVEPALSDEQKGKVPDTAQESKGKRSVDPSMTTVSDDLNLEKLFEKTEALKHCKVLTRKNKTHPVLLWVKFEEQKNEKKAQICWHTKGGLWTNELNVSEVKEITFGHKPEYTTLKWSKEQEQQSICIKTGGEKGRILAVIIERKSAHKDWVAGLRKLVKNQNTKIVTS